MVTRRLPLTQRRPAQTIPRWLLTWAERGASLEANDWAGWRNLEDSLHRAAGLNQFCMLEVLGCEAEASAAILEAVEAGELDVTDQPGFTLTYWDMMDLLERLGLREKGKGEDE